MMDSFCASSSNSTPLIDSIRRTIEERNILTARSKVKYVTALKSANQNGESATSSSVSARIEKLKSKVVAELMSSERVYLKQLNWILSEFKHPLESSFILSRRDMDILFGNIELITSLNKELYKELNEEKSIAPPFTKFSPMLKIYSAYALNYQQAISTLDAIMSSNPSGAEFIKEKEESLRTKLSALLIVPIQRIPRYKLLLEQLLSFSSKDEMNDEIKGALETINEVAHHMNEMVRNFENSQKILKIQSYFRKKLKIELVQPGRFLIKNGIVLKPPKNHKRYMILFNDSVYFCKMKNSGANMKLFSPHVVPLKKSVVNMNGSLIMIHCQGETPITFTSTDSDELAEWHTIISETIKSLKKRVATLRKESSKKRPIRIKKGGENKIATTPLRDKNILEKIGDTPGRLKRCLNVSAHLDEIVDFLSPKKQKREAPNRLSRLM